MRILWVAQDERFATTLWQSHDVSHGGASPGFTGIHVQVACPDVKGHKLDGKKRAASSSLGSRLSSLVYGNIARNAFPTEGFGGAID